MKIRKGFISNSSSTSFICDVCGRAEGGMDMSLEDADMYECKNGHTFCREESIGKSVVDEDGKEIITEKTYTLPEDDEEGGYEIPTEHCPCCTFAEVSSYDLIDYLLKKAGKDREAVAKEIKEKFADFKTFRNYVNEDVK